MALSLNKRISMAALLLFLCTCAFSQEEKTKQEKTDNVFSDKELEHDPSDYKDPKQFEKFSKRKNIIGAWQINQLKKGALVVRLKTNKKLIDALKAEGKEDMARQKELDQYAINKNTMLAYMDYLKFCKVYFIYSHNSDTLLKGVRKGIFLDTTLNVNPAIEMAGDFYILAERDYAYNSSIGFVPEDSARSVSEAGNPVKEMAIVLKNKYGHQIKGPFPYCVKEKSTNEVMLELPIYSTPRPGGETVISFPVNKTYLADQKNPNAPAVARRAPNQQYAKIPKELTYERVAAAVDQMNDYLNQYYQANPNPDLSRVDPEVKKFLY